MSINFQDKPNKEALQAMQEAFGPSTADDEKRFLYDQLPQPISGRKMSLIAKAAGQPVSLEIHDLGDEINLDDGRVFRCVEDGWQCVRSRSK